MIKTKADLYLPISQQFLTQLTDRSADNLEKAISSLSVSQIASLLLLQKLPKNQDKHPAYLERALAAIIDSLDSQWKTNGLSPIRVEVISALNFKNIEEGSQLLSSLKIALLDEETIKDQNYLTPEGKWDYTFNERYSEQVMKFLVRKN